MTVQTIGTNNNRFVGASTDTKPTGVQIGATFYEYDTKWLYITFDGSSWMLKDTPDGFISNVTTINLKQAAGNYDLFTVSLSDIEVLEIAFITRNSLTGETTFSSISIQSTDTTPVEFISATAGAKANLIADACLKYDGIAKVEAGKKIQLTIAGGATAADQVCEVSIAYREVV
jgi:hypothetical protein